MKLTECERQYAIAKVNTVVVKPTNKDYEQAITHSLAIKDLVAIKPTYETEYYAKSEYLY